MNEGSGGIGAVSSGISEPIVLIILIVLAVLVAFGGWKLLKLVLAAIAGDRRSLVLLAQGLLN